MKRGYRDAIAGCLVLLTAFGAFAVLKAPPNSPRANTNTRPEEPFVEDAASPEISLSVNGVSDAVVREGESLLVEAAFTRPDGSSGKSPLVLNGGPGGWGSAARISIVNAQGLPAASAATRLVTKTEPSLSLEGTTYGSLVWIVELSGAAKLAPGDYTVVVNFDTSKSSFGGWKGTIESYPSSLTVRPSGPLSAEEEIFAAAAQARVHAAADRLPEALAVCDQFLAKNPKDGAIREVKADLLAESGKFEEAFAVYNELLGELKLEQNKPLQEFPILLLKKRDLVLEELKKKD